VKTVPDLEDDSIPAWQRQSMERSLQSARARAHARSDRFVAAAIKLLQEKGSTDFTVQDVVERSQMSTRTFYKYFASKDDLLVAVYETVVARDTVPQLKKSIEKSRDPRLRLRAYIEGLVELAARTEVRAARTLTNYGNRLAETRPDDLARAMKPQFDLLVELIRDVARTRTLRRDLTPESAARLTNYTVLAAVHDRVRGVDGAGELSARMISQFCLSGMGFDAKS
jgi:AcrR family transcriptional regulator